MQRTDHWNETNTNALIEGISGIAGNLINAKKQGYQLNPNEQQVAYLAQQTAAALGNANQYNMRPDTGNLGISNTTIMIIGGVLLVVIGVILFKHK